ncbi:hypothetical protein BJX62DRAFT_107656 [Aspergillus germanicus]
MLSSRLLNFSFLHLPIHAQNTHDTQLHEYPHRKRRHMNTMRKLLMIGIDIMKDNDRTYSWMIWVPSTLPLNNIQHPAWFLCSAHHHRNMYIPPRTATYPTTIECNFLCCIKSFLFYTFFFSPRYLVIRVQLSPGTMGRTLEWTGIFGMDMDMDMIQKWTNYILKLNCRNDHNFWSSISTSDVAPT